MRWHIYGAGSYVASRLIPFLGHKKQQLFLYTRSETANSRAFDLAAPSIRNVSDIKDGDIAVILAANSSADACQNEYETAYRVNVTGTGQLISLCLKKGARVIFFSSDLVFGNMAEACNEMTEVSPFGNYALMKLEIERMFRNEKNFKALRTSTMLSKDARFIRYLYDCDKEGKNVEIYDAFYRNFVSLDDVAEAVFKLGQTFDTYENQYLHLCGDELLSRQNLAEIYRQVVSPSLRYTVKEPPEEFFEARPKRIELHSLYLEQLLGRRPTAISCALKREFKGG